MQICIILIISFFFCVTTSVAQTCHDTSIPESTPNNQLLDNGNGTVSDNKTGLMWKKCVEGVSGNKCNAGSANTFTWEQARKHPGRINNLGGFAGHDNWRLPNIEELISIVEKRCYNPSININRFPGSSSDVWSGSPYTSNSSSAWFVSFHNGTPYNYNRFAGFTFQVRLVRDGQ